jgi:type I restriction enzyme S subunit
MIGNQNIPKLRFPGFDGEWENSVLNKFASLNPKNSSLPESFVYIDLESVTDGHLIKENIISKNEAPSRAQRILKEKDILYQTVRPYQKNNLYFNKVGQYVASTGYAQIRTKNDSKFLFHFLHTEKFVANVMLRCTGTSYPAINSTDLSNIEISFPTLPEQQKIASFLSAVDEKIQQLSRKKELLEQYKKGVMQQLFSGKLRFKDENGSFRKGKLRDFGYFYYGKGVPKTSVVIGAKTPCVRYGELYSTYKEEIKHIKSYTNISPKDLKLSKGGEVLVPRVGEDPRDFANCSYLPFPNVAIGEMISVYNTEEDGLFMTYYINAMLKKQLAKLVEGGNVSNLYFRYVETIEVEIPSLKVQKKIVKFLSSIDAKIDNTKDELEKIQLFKKGLLQKMFV